MSNTITLTETSVNTLMSTYQGIQLESAPSSTGAFSLVARIPYVTNQTTYTYVDAAGVSTTWYRTARYTHSLTLGPYSAAWPVSGYAPGNTLQQYRWRLAETAGYNMQLIATAGSARADQVVCSNLQSTELETTFLGNTWLYQPSGPNAGQCRRIQYQTGLDAGSGTITVERAFPQLTPLGQPFELYGRLPPIKYEARIGLNDIVNRVLAECWTVQRIGTQINQDQTLYPLNQLMPWLRWDDQFVDVYWQAPDPNNPQVVNGPSQWDQLVPTWALRSGADSPQLQIGTPLQPGGTLKPEVFVPMSWWLNRGSGWMVTTSEGLVNDSDQALLSLQGMEVLGAAWIFGELAKWGHDEDQANYRQQQSRARAAANEWKRLALERPVGRKHHWPEMMIVPSPGNYGYQPYPWGP